MKKIVVIAQTVYFSIRLLINTKNSTALIKLGNLLSQTEAFEECVKRAKSDLLARELIEERFRTSIPEVPKLKNYSQDSLGRAYYEHMTKNNLSTYKVQENVNFSEAEYLRERQREIHDLLHPLLDLGIDPSSEAALNAFVMAQVYAPISILIVVGATIQILFTQPSKLSTHFESIFKFWQMGKQSRSIFSLKWENFLETSIDQVRVTLLHS